MTDTSNDDYQGWILTWCQPQKLRYRKSQEEPDVWINGYLWSDENYDYDIYAPSLKGPFLIETCTADDLGNNIATLEEAKLICQRDHAGIMITFHGSRAEYEAEKAAKKSR